MKDVKLKDSGKNGATCSGCKLCLTCDIFSFRIESESRDMSTISLKQSKLEDGQRWTNMDKDRKQMEIDGISFCISKFRILHYTHVSHST